MVDGKRQWITYPTQAVDDSDFVQLGTAYEEEMKLAVQRIGNAEVRLLEQRPLVDWATTWMERYRD
ncbi:Aminoglycoside 3-N-acetyltransferase [compost metagenome]